MFVFGLIGVLMLFIAIISFRLVYLSRATNGDMIAKYNSPKSALLVLDIQNDTLGIKQYGNTEPLIANINKAIAYAKHTNLDILYTKQEFSAPSLDSLLTGGMYKANSNGSSLYTGLAIESNNIFSKVRNDAFSVLAFEQYLIQNQIDTLYIVGADASACVNTTVTGGLNRGYRMVVLQDSIFSIRHDRLKTMLKTYESKGADLTTLYAFTSTHLLHE